MSYFNSWYSLLILSLNHISLLVGRAVQLIQTSCSNVLWHPEREGMCKGAKMLIQSILRSQKRIKLKLQFIISYPETSVKIQMSSYIQYRLQIMHM